MASQESRRSREALEDENRLLRYQLHRIQDFGRAGIWALDDCVVAAVTGLEGSEAGRREALAQEANRDA